MLFDDDEYGWKCVNTTRCAILGFLCIVIILVGIFFVCKKSDEYQNRPIHYIDYNGVEHTGNCYSHIGKDLVTCNGRTIKVLEKWRD